MPTAFLKSVLPLSGPSVLTAPVLSDVGPSFGADFFPVTLCFVSATPRTVLTLEEGGDKIKYEHGFAVCFFDLDADAAPQ